MFGKDFLDNMKSEVVIQLRFTRRAEPTRKVAYVDPFTKAGIQRFTSLQITLESCFSCFLKSMFIGQYLSGLIHRE